MSESTEAAAPTSAAAEASAPEKTALSAEASKSGSEAAAKPGVELHDKTTEAAKPVAQKPVVPEKYDLKLPKDAALSAARIEKITAYAKAQGLSNEQAQAIVERENDAVAEFVSGQSEAIKAKASEWKQESVTDKEIGGDDHKRNVEIAARVLKRYGSEPLLSALDETGLGNHPELVRVFVRIGKAMSEDQLVLPGTQAGGKKSIEDVFYGGTTN